MILFIIFLLFGVILGQLRGQDSNGILYSTSDSTEMPGFCRSPKPPPNVKFYINGSPEILKEFIPVNVHVVVYCDVGYELKGGKYYVVLICQGDGQWSDATPECRRLLNKQEETDFVFPDSFSTTEEVHSVSESDDNSDFRGFCKVPESIFNGQIFVNGQTLRGFVPPGHQLKAICDKGYHLEGNKQQAVIICENDGLWSEWLGCSRDNPTTESDIDHGYHSSSAGFSTTEEVHSVSKSDDNSDFRGFCKVPESIFNGQIFVNGQNLKGFVPPGHQLKAICDKGYHLAGNKQQAVIICENDGLWSEWLGCSRDNPTTESADLGYHSFSSGFSTTEEVHSVSESDDNSDIRGFCKVPESIFNGRIFVNGQTLRGFVPPGHQVKAICDKGYHLEGNKQQAVIFCETYGLWSEWLGCSRDNWLQPNLGASFELHSSGPSSTNRQTGASETLGLCYGPGTPLNGHLSIEGEGWNGFYPPGTQAKISCHDGFELVGAKGLSMGNLETSSCLENGEWSHPVEFICRDKNPTTESAGLGYHSFSSGSSGSYHIPLLCYVPRVPENGNLDLDVIYNGLMRPGSLATFSCQEGYQLEGGKDLLVLTCNETGEWSEFIPECRSLNETSSSKFNGRCNIPHPPANRAFTFKDGCSKNCSSSFVVHGEEMSVTCLPGYSLVERGMIIYSFSTECNHGVWNPPIPTCRVVCPPLDTSGVDFLCWRGTTIVNCRWALLPETKVAYRCDDNLENRNGNSNGSMICRSNGQWSHPIPSCSEITCPTLYSPTVDFLCWQGQLLTSCTDQKMFPGTDVQYSCKEFYETNSTESNRMTCNNNGQWSQDIPSCTPKKLCSPLVSLTETFSCRYEFSELKTCTKSMLPGTRAYFTCAEGHDYTDRQVSQTTGSLKCFPSGRWSSDPPFCSPIGTTGMECAVPDPPENRQFARYNCRGCSTETVPDAGLLVVTCDPGYSLVQGVFIQATRALTNCLNGVWDPPIPQCLKLCPPLVSLTVDLTCWLGRDLVSCNRPMLPGTLVEYSCKEYHETIDKNPNAIRCSSKGDWSRELPNCSPQCGYSNLNSAELRPTILGGTPSSPGNFPWHAAIYHWSRDDWEAVCGGTLVSPRLVLTAAHCVTTKCEKCSPSPVKPTQDIRVALGKINRKWNHSESTEVKKQVQEIFVHQYYVGSSLNYGNDIAVLVLQSPVRVNNYVMPACVDHSLHFLKRLKDDHSLMGYVPGWGNTEECSSFGDVCTSPSDNLKFARTAIINFTECFEFTQKIKTFSLSRLTQDKYCAGNGSESVVQQGDSGGGLTFEFNGLHYVYGVVSVKVKLEIKNQRFYSFGAFTSVASHLPWLKTKLY